MISEARRYQRLGWTATIAAALFAAPASACVGDCERTGRVGLPDLGRALEVVLGAEELDTCDAIDRDGDDLATVDEVVSAVGNALDGCPTVVDQRWEGPVGSCAEKPSITIQIRAGAPISQQFTPTISLLQAVEVYIRAATPPYEATLTLNLRAGAAGGAILASRTVDVPYSPGPLFWQRFDLEDPVALQPEALYAIELQSTNAAHMWLADHGVPPCDPADYPRGAPTAFGGVPDGDFNFRTIAIP